MFDNLLLPLGISLILYGIYKWITLNNDYFEKRGIQHMKPTFALGNTGAFFMRQYRSSDFMQNLYRQFPDKKIFGMFDFRKPMYFIRDPEIIKRLAVKDFDHFENHRSFIDEDADLLFGNSLFMLKGEKWRDMRATLSPAFTGSKMRQMFELVVENSSDMVQHFQRKAKSSAIGGVDVEMKDLFSRYTNDVIASAAFGCKVNSFQDESNDFYLNGKKILNFNSPKAALKLIGLRLLPRFMKMLDINLTDSALTKFFRKMVVDNMSTREKEGIFRPDMINILMNVRKGNTLDNADKDEKQSGEGFATVEESHIGTKQVKRQWTDDELVAQCFLFFAAGFDTSSTLLSFVAHELAVNPDVQQRLYEEVCEVEKTLNGKPLPYDVLQKMKYIDCVISETLRYWPPAPMTDRLCVKDYEYDDGVTKFKFEKGLAFWIPIYPLHHDEKYFPNPEKFDPERFNDDNKDSIKPGTFLPFGIGPRNCIGSRFALMEVKSVIYHLLLHFKFEPNENSQIPINLSKQPFGMTSEKGVNLRLAMRK